MNFYGVTRRGDIIKFSFVIVYLAEFILYVILNAANKEDTRNTV